MSKIKYRHFPQDEGNVLRFRTELTADDIADITAEDGEDRQSPELIEHVGTYGCITCVGVYFAISHEIGFAAHISANVYRDIDGDDLGIRVLTPEEGAMMKDKVMYQFHRCAKRYEWSPEDPKTHDYIRQSLIMVCPRHDKIVTHPISLVERKQAAVYVVEAIREFLHVSEDECPVDTTSQGFLARHTAGRSGEPHMFAWEDEVWDGMPPSTIVGFERRAEPRGGGKWSFDLTPQDRPEED